MGSPRHLWSGDWQFESAAAAEELARRRAQGEPIAPPEPEPPPRLEPKQPSGRPAPKPRARSRRKAPTFAWRRRPRVVRVAALAAAVTLLCAGAAYGLTSLLSGSGSRQSLGGGASAWLGMNVGGLPVGGVLVTSVVPNGPAYAAGVRPGDVITEVGNQRVASPDDVDSAIAPLRPGAHVKIEFDRGPATYVTQATLQSHRRGSP